MKKIQIHTYDALWPVQYDHILASIKTSLGERLLDAHHVGSTAVPGLCAKPIIDIILCVSTLDDAIPCLKVLGYAFKGEVNIPFRAYFTKKDHVHLHVYEKDHPEIALNLTFRDYVRAHPEVKDQYAALKKSLLKDTASHEKGSGRFSGYTLGKSDFIKGVLRAAGFNKVRMTHATHEDEWHAVKSFRQHTFFDAAGLQDPYTWTFHHHDHVHLVLYEGVEIRGYTHLKKWGTRACLRIIVIDLPYRGGGFGTYFLGLCEKWLKSQGVESLHLDASPTSLSFYLKHGYVSAPLNDPDGYPSDPQDTPLVKELASRENNIEGLS
ncbi:MAG: GNAT family N-acetyltransferase [Alphaproteobacteria bacterium]|nr:GNAT family N-acetyltransferase [Alphaproteobacteria bacterium]